MRLSLWYIFEVLLAMFLMDLMDATANQGSTGNTCTMYHARSPPITGSRPRRRVRNLGLLQGCYVDAPPVVVEERGKWMTDPRGRAEGRRRFAMAFLDSLSVVVVADTDGAGSKRVLDPKAREID
jgi:hypothetical protein